MIQLLHRGYIKFVSALMALYRYFKPVSKGLPHPEGPLSKTLPLATIKAASEYDSYALWR